jgi:flagellar protein FlgJ
VGEDSTDEELMEACQSFESYFVQKMIEEAKKTLDNEDEQGEYTSMFADMKNEELADAITESGQIGLAQQLYDNIKDQYNL